MIIKELKQIEDYLTKNNVYIISSIDGVGVHVGRFKGFSLDANDDLVIDADIDSISCTS